MTLNETLKSIGYTSAPGPHGRKFIFDSEGLQVGCFTAGECWEYLAGIGKV